MIATDLRPCHSVPEAHAGHAKQSYMGGSTEVGQEAEEMGGKMWAEALTMVSVWKRTGMRVGRFRTGYFELFQWGSVETWGD